MSEPELPRRSLTLPCEDAEEFRSRWVPVLTAGGLRVHAERPEPLGTRVWLSVRLGGSGLHVSGEAVAVRHGLSLEGPAVYYHFTRLAPDSLPFPLETGPGPRDEEPTPVTTPPGSTGAPAVPAVLRAPAAAPGRAEQEPWAGGLRPFDTLGSYQLLRRLGQGGMAEVFLARARLGGGVDKLVALKVVRPEFGPGTPFGSLFLDEARIGVTLQHPNVVPVFDVGEWAGRPFLAMEHVAGKNLAEVLRLLLERGRPPPLAFGVAVAIELCRALEYLHERTHPDGRPMHLVHRDLSPGNVLLTERGEVKLVDFGVAAASLDAQGGRRLVVGKRAYMSPEQAQGQSPPTPAWDLYGLGVVLHQMLTLERLFGGDTSEVRLVPVRMRQQLPPSSSNPEVPKALDWAVLWATDLDPQRRCPSARALRTHLEKVRAQLPAFDLGAFCREVMQGALAEERLQGEALLAEARARRGGAWGRLWRPLARPFGALWRHVAARPAFLHLARRPGLVTTLALALLLLAGGGVAWGWRTWARDAQLDAHLGAADARLAQARLVGPGGDAALDHLLAARALAPDDPRVATRLALITGTFEQLGRAARERGDLAEAAAHLQAAVLASPERRDLADALARVEQQMRTRPASSVRRAP